MNAREPWVDRHVVAPPSVDCEPLSPPRPPRQSTAAGWAQVVVVLGLLALFCIVCAHWFGTL